MGNTFQLAFFFFLLHAHAFWILSVSNRFKCGGISSLPSAHSSLPSAHDIAIASIQSSLFLKIPNICNILIVIYIYFLIIFSIFRIMREFIDIRYNKTQSPNNEISWSTIQAFVELFLRFASLLVFGRMDGLIRQIIFDWINICLFICMTLLEYECSWKSLC